MNESLVREVIEIAKWYPSGGNKPPFCFRFCNDKQNPENSVLEVNYIAERSKHCLVYDEHLVLLTLGFAIEYLRNVFYLKGHSVSFSFDFDNFAFDKDKKAICSIKVAENAQFDWPTFNTATLLERVTDRRKYKAITEDEAGYIKELVFQSQTAFHLNLSARILKFFSLCDAQLWNSKTLGLEIFDEAKFSGKPLIGMPWKNLGVDFFEAMPIWFIQKMPFLFSVFKPIAFPMMKLIQYSNWRSSASALIYKENINDSRETRVINAMKLMNDMLRLTGEGYVSQPSTLSTHILNYPIQKQDANLENTKAKLALKDLNKDIVEVRDNLTLDDDAFVGWILRIGKAKEGRLNKNCRTLREGLDSEVQGGVTLLSVSQI